MLTQEQYYLIKIAEECAEIQQRITKALCFGLDEIQQSNPNETRTNRDRIVEEFNDLIATSEVLNDQNPDYDFGNFAQIDKKKIRLKKYFDYSISLGIVSKEPNQT